VKIHEKYIKRALQIAKNGLPSAMPNPSVGAVIVHENEIIGEGYTSPYGGAHAEVHAIRSVHVNRSKLGKDFAKADTEKLLSQSTLYVTLEPCSHHGKTPPCADLIIKNGIKKVIIGTVDPFAKVAGAGIKKLKDAGIEVVVGFLEAACIASNIRFFTFYQKKRPYIILKWAETQDGFIAPKTRNAQAPVWITNTYSRQLVHKWRSEEQAILVGANTVIADNPSLTTRSWEGKNPTRIVISNGMTLDPNMAIYNDAAPTITIDSHDITEICDTLYTEGIQSVLIEGGAKTLQRFIDTNVWDEARIFKGTTAFKEGTRAPQLSKKFEILSTQNISNDIVTMYKNTTA